MRTLHRLACNEATRLQPQSQTATVMTTQTSPESQGMRFASSGDEISVDPGKAVRAPRSRPLVVYRYVWRDDLSDTFDESVRVLLPVERQSVCLVRATVPDPL